MNYCRKLDFEEDPDYKYLTELFEGCMIRDNKDPKDLNYTWKKKGFVKDKSAALKLMGMT